MLCILKLSTQAPSAPDAIAGWIFATDVFDARRQAFAAGEVGLATHLGPDLKFEHGKHYLCHAMDGDECWALA